MRNDSNPSARREGFRFLRKLALYLCLTFLIAGILQFWLVGVARPMMNEAEWITLLKREWVRDGWGVDEAAATHVVALGDSRVLAAFDPVAFDHATGGKTRSYNLALPASTSATHLAVLHDLLASGKRPDWLVLALSPDTEARSNLAAYKSLGVTNLSELTASVLTHPEGKKILMDWMLPGRRFQKEIVRWMNLRLLSPDGLMKAQDKERKFAQRLREQRGVFATTSVLDPNGTQAKSRNFLNLNADLDPACREILELAARHRVPVFVISPPVRPGALLRNPESAIKAMEVGSGLDNIVFSKNFFDPVALPLDQFADAVHVNASGAVRFSRQLADEFAGLPDEENQHSMTD